MREEREGRPAGNYRERTRRRLRDIVEDAAGEGPLFTPLDMRETGPNAEAHLFVRWRCHPRLPEPDECETAILQLLYVAHGPLRYRQLVTALDSRYGERTVSRRLRRLRRLGLVRCGRRPPRGYTLDEWLRSQADLAEPA